MGEAPWSLRRSPGSVVATVASNGERGSEHRGGFSE